MESQELANGIVVSKLRAWDAQAIADTIVFRNELTLVIPRDRVRAVAEFLRDDAELQFNLLCDITATDRFPIEPRFDLNYQLLSLSRKERLRLKVRLAGNDAVAASVVPVWPGANWHEREVWDLFGIRFEGHPDLTRILMPDDWEGHPLRKDYPTEGYR